MYTRIVAYIYYSESSAVGKVLWMEDLTIRKSRILLGEHEFAIIACPTHESSSVFTVGFVCFSSEFAANDPVPKGCGSFEGEQWFGWDKLSQ